MPITRDGDGWRFTLHYRKPSRSKPGKTVATTINRKFRTREEALTFELDFRNKIAGGSLTAPYFSDLVAHYLSEKTRGGMSQRCFDRAVEDLGTLRVDRSFDEAYHAYARKLRTEGFKPNTLNNYFVSVRSVLNYAWKTGKLDQVPVRYFALESAVERDRVFEGDERQRLENVMQACNSYLCMPVYFAERNPIRETDLFGLTRDNYNQFNRTVSFLPQKTAKRRSRHTLLLEIDDAMVQWFNGLPADCPHLFPKLKDDGSWEQIRDYNKHWSKLCEAAKIEDFHFHDLRHVATTYMLEKRTEYGIRVYEEDDMQSLGLFYSKRIIEVYRNRSAHRVLDRVRSLTARDHSRSVSGAERRVV
jgi:integrase